MCEQKNLGFIEASAFEATNVDLAFEKIVTGISDQWFILIFKKEIYNTVGKK